MLDDDATISYALRSSLPEDVKSQERNMMIILLKFGNFLIRDTAIKEKL